MQGEQPTLYQQVGREVVFRQLVDLFYAKVEADSVLRSIFPADMEAGKHAQFLFLMQFFGGPQTYGEERGHPRLRMRHFPFSIDQQARDSWLKHMLEALDEVGIAEPMRGEMRVYFERASTHMINKDA